MWLLVLFVVVQGNSLREEFELYTADSSVQQLFAYKPDVVCIVERGLSSLYVRLQKLHTFERTSSITIHDGERLSDHRADACFELDGVSYLVLRNAHRNQTTVISGQEHRILNLNYDLLRYDYTDESVYVFVKNTIKKYAARQLLAPNITALPLATITLPIPFNDAMVTAGRIFLLHQRVLYELRENGDCPVIENASHDTFWFQLFTKKPLFCLSEMSSSLAYMFQFALLLFIIYCLRYKMTVRQVDNAPPAYEFTPIIRQ